MVFKPDGTFPSLKAFGPRVLAECSRSGSVLRTLGGRARSFPALRSSEPGARARALRQAVNYVVQGSAADLCKVAMVGAHRRLALRPGAARLLLQLHDELVWEVSAAHLPWAVGIVKEEMEGSGQQCGMSQRLPVAVSIGPNWGNMTPI
ncbi:hypothetical protein evm_006477 [Chilo suppressalis]|nr:hypothetical protein evm_006477 [Chilo suppressalis]